MRPWSPLFLTRNHSGAIAWLPTRPRIPAARLLVRTFMGVAKYVVDLPKYRVVRQNLGMLGVESVLTRCFALCIRARLGDLLVTQATPLRAGVM